MANTLTGLIPTLYESLDIVSRELTGMTSAVARNSSIERAAKDQTVTIPIVPASTAADITPGQQAPNTGDMTAETVDMTISKSRAVPVRINGEEERSLGTAGTAGTVMRDRFTQAMRTLSNEVSADLCGLYTGASRAFGTASTTPFATAGEFDDAAEVFKILDDNGAPRIDRQLVLGTTAMAKLKGFQSSLFKVNEAGTDGLLRGGSVGRLMGFDLYDDAQIASHTKGTATGFDANGGEPVGETAIVCDGSDAGTILAGDIVTWAGDANKYVVADGDTLTGNASGSMTLAKPGLQAALATTVEGTIGNSYTANLAFHKDAIQLVTRLPAAPSMGDSAIDATEIVDPNTGLAFEVRVYAEHRQVHIAIGLAWGYQVIKPEHVAILLG